MEKYTDEQLLYGAFGHILHLHSSLAAYRNNDPKYLFADGFEDPIDKDEVSDWLLSLADRCGYKLLEGMWVEK